MNTTYLMNINCSKNIEKKKKNEKSTFELELMMQ